MSMGSTEAQHTHAHGKETHPVLLGITQRVQEDNTENDNLFYRFII